MEGYVTYLLYLSIVLILGILATAVSSKLKISNILLLVLVGYVLKKMNFSYFNYDIVLVLSELALIMIVLESTTELNFKHIVQNFFPVLKYSIIYFVLSTYIITLAVFYMFDFQVKGFSAFVLCFLLSIIIYGIDPSIAMEFSKVKKSRPVEMLEIEGAISTPFVAVFSFFVIDYLVKSETSFSLGILKQFLVVGKQIVLAAVIGVVLAYALYRFIKNFELPKELSVLLMLAIAISSFVLGEFFAVDGSICVAIYGLMLRGLTKEEMDKKVTSIFAHTLYIIVFVLLGTEFFFPGFKFWMASLGLFVFYLLLRFLCIFIFIKELKIREKIFMTLNVSKGIEVAIVLFVMKLNFSDIPELNLVLGIGFIFFILGYVVSTITNHYADLLVKC